MRDGYTREIQRAPRGNPTFQEHQERWQAILVIVSGGAEGTEFVLDQPETTLGRGPDVDLAFDDQTMSREHVAIEFVGTGFRARDLGSRNGMLVNGSETRVTDLASGDRLQIGGVVMQLVLEKRETPPKTYVLPDED